MGGRRRGVWSAVVAVLLVVGVAPGAAGSAMASTSTGSGSTGVGRAEGLFSDVGPTHAFAAEIGWLVDRSITSGFTDGTFRPAGVITRQGMAAFLYRLAGSPEVGDALPTFTDVPSTHAFATEIGWLASTGVTTGFTDGTFRPAGVITRQAMAAFLFRLTGASPVPGSEGSFPDVPSGHPFGAEIGWLASTGVTTGFTDGTFRPAGPVSRQGMAAFLHRLTGNPFAWADASLLGVAPPEPVGVSCAGFDVWGAANRWFGWFEPWFGDVADLVPDGGDRPCPSLYEPIAAPDTVVIDEADADQLDTSTIGGWRFSFPAAWAGGDAIDVGSVVVGPPTVEAPSGFLVRITSRSEDAGAVTVTFEQAQVTDAIHQGVGGDAFPVGLDDLAYVAPGITVEQVPAGGAGASPPVGGGAVEFDWSETETWAFSGTTPAGPATIDVNAEIELGVTVGLDVGCGETLLDVCVLPELQAFDAEAAMRGEARVRFAGPSIAEDDEVVLFESRPLPFRFLVGVVPVFGSARIVASVSAEGSVSTNLEATVELGYEESHAVRYTPAGGIRGESARSPLDAEVVGTPERPEATVELAAAAEVKAVVSLYGIDGPQAGVAALGTLRWSSEQPYAAGAFAGIDASAGFELDEAQLGAFLDLLGLPEDAIPAQHDLLEGVEAEANLYGWYRHGDEWTEEPLVFDPPAATPPGTWDGEQWDTPPQAALPPVSSGNGTYPPAGRIIEVALGDESGDPHTGEGGVGPTTLVADGSGLIDLSVLEIDEDTPPGTYTLIIRHENDDHQGWANCLTGCRLWRPLDDEFETVSPPFEVAPIEITPEVLPALVPGQPYEVQFEAEGGSPNPPDGELPPYVFEIIEGDLPVGLTLDEEGLLSGTVDAEDATGGPWPFTLQATDSNEGTGEVELVLSTGTEPMVTGGLHHSCKLASTGAVTCWGSQFWDLLSPIVTPGGTFVDMDSSTGTGCCEDATWGTDFMCGVRSGGALECWGFPSGGLLGLALPAGSFTSVSVGTSHVCGLRVSGTVSCVGEGEPGPGGNRLPIVSPGGTFATISSGDRFGCGLRTDGTIGCWGSNYSGESTPPGGTFTAVDVGWYYGCGVRTGGTLACWGSNFGGITTPPGGTFTSVSTGLQHACGVRTDGTVVCWGVNTFGQTNAPEGEFVAVGLGGQHSCAMRADESVVCWGYDEQGQATPP